MKITFSLIAISASVAVSCNVSSAYDYGQTSLNDIRQSQDDGLRAIREAQLEVERLRQEREQRELQLQLHRQQQEMERQRFELDQQRLEADMQRQKLNQLKNQFDLD